MFSLECSDHIRLFDEYKSVINSYNFFVEFVYNEKHANLATDMILPMHIIGVDIPTYSFSRSNINYGATQYSFPVLNKEQALDIKLTLEEDIHGSVGDFIRYLTETITKDGLHVAPADSRIGDMYIYIMDSMKNPINIYIAKDIFFLGYDSLSLTYDSNESIKYSVTFGTDHLISERNKEDELDRQRSFKFSRDSFK